MAQAPFIRRDCAHVRADVWASSSSTWRCGTSQAELDFLSAQSAELLGRVGVRRFYTLCGSSRTRSAALDGLVRGRSASSLNVILRVPDWRPGRVQQVPFLHASF